MIQATSACTLGFLHDPCTPKTHMIPQPTPALKKLPWSSSAWLVLPIRRQCHLLLTAHCLHGISRTGSIVIQATSAVEDANYFRASTTLAVDTACAVAACKSGQWGCAGRARAGTLLSAHVHLGLGSRARQACWHALFC